MKTPFDEYCLYYDNYKYFIKKYSNYSYEEINKYEKFNYNYESHYIKQLERYIPNKFIKNDVKDINLILLIMRWVNEKLLYKNMIEKNINSLHAADILLAAKKNNKTVNCLCHATVLTETLLCLGFKAKTIKCLPIGMFPQDNHCLTMVFCNNNKKWIALDPTYNLYFQDKNSNYLAIHEIRQLISNNKQVNVQSNHRIQSDNIELIKKIYIKYMAKNLFRFSTYKNAVFKVRGEIEYQLIPKDYLPLNQYIIKTKKRDVTIKYISNPNFFWQL
ncbi:hypothetical protein SH1V18_28690 [Vallitalea longa]|uniref:Transglutaminase-like domain-containing protein n=1 Tax=Vallitalea longa TaxID=2936439 RepID=A0A9W5YC41_9FIRM|nr:hypothetical protein [Vallitalea longa]GKX30389.1 hypothetical protein SH1V18_28690 [Vallitalea longa]